MTRAKPPRLAVRAIVIHDGRLLLVNAWPNGKSALLCAPGGGVEPHQSLPDNLRREVFEETGLHIDVGLLCLVNEFHDPGHDFHQVELFFRCQVHDAKVPDGWRDTAGIVTDRHWLTPAEVAAAMVKPDSLKTIAFSAPKEVYYDALEPIVK